MSVALIGTDPSFLEIVRHAARVARVGATVLLRGETGTGKEVCARMIHSLGPRAHKPFIPFNCGAVPVDLLENELFGHESGAFTSASAHRQGLIRSAEGGVLFLDEIDSLPLPAQVKLLRFLQEKEYRPLGSSHTVTADVRIMAASNANLEDAVRCLRLRADLYYRLNILSIHLPPLRERRQDIPTLANHFLAKYCAEFQSPARTFCPSAFNALCRYDWPGNIRELESAVLRAVALADEPVLTERDFALLGTAAGGESFREAKAKAVRQFEIAYIQGLLVAHQGNVSRAATAAGKHRRALWQLIRKHKISVDGFRAVRDQERVPV